MGRLHYNVSKTLSGMLREVTVRATVSGLNRFLISPAWSVTSLDQARFQHFTGEVGPKITWAHHQQKVQHVLRRGRPSVD